MKREIIVKTLMGKGKLSLEESKEISLNEIASKTLGCWIINHRYEATLNDKEVSLNGTYDVQLWYATDNDSKTNVYYETIPFSGIFTMSYRSLESLSDDILLKVHVIKYPTACKMELVEENKVRIFIESEYLVDTFQDAILSIETLEEDNEVEVIDEEIVMNVNPNYIKDNNQ